MSEAGLGQAIQTVGLLAIIAVSLFIVVVALNRSSSRRWHWDRPREYRPHADVSQNPAPDLADVGWQLRSVMEASFQKRRVMNRSEYRVFRIVEQELVAAFPGHRAFAQTSLGQILQSPNENGFRSINAKRIDVLVIDRCGWPVLAIEYQGEGHYQGTAAARDAIKKEALRKAGVQYLEITATNSDDQIRARLRDHLVTNAAVASAT